MDTTLKRLEVLINSSTPIVVMETVEEMRAVRLVCVVCSSLNIAVFEWSIASGLVRCGSGHAEVVPETGGFVANPELAAHGGDARAIYNSREPAQALGNIEAFSADSVVILKDFHRHMDDPVVVRRLRDVGQKFFANRRTVIITAPSISVPPELVSLVEYVELPLPDKTRLRQIVDETIARISKTRTLRRSLDEVGLAGRGR